MAALAGTSSRNSSKPPSADRPAKPAPKPLRQASGGQVGHDGTTLARVAHPDEVVRHEPRACSGAGPTLAGAPDAGTVRPQVFDLSPILYVSSIRSSPPDAPARRTVAGARRNKSTPGAVRAATVMIYLVLGQFRGAHRLRALSELFGAPVKALPDVPVAETGMGGSVSSTLSAPDCNARAEALIGAEEPPRRDLLALLPASLSHLAFMQVAHPRSKEKS